MFLSQSLSQLADLDPANHGSEGIFYCGSLITFPFISTPTKISGFAFFFDKLDCGKCLLCLDIPHSSLMLGFLSLQSDMLDVNQIIKDLASMVHEQGDTIGRCHMKIMGFITLFHHSNMIWSLSSSPLLMLSLFSLCFEHFVHPEMFRSDKLPCAIRFLCYGQFAGIFSIK